MIHVENEVTVREISGKEVPLGSYNLRIESHWNKNNAVVLTYDNVRLTVLATDLQQAIVNATKSNRFG